MEKKSLILFLVFTIILCINIVNAEISLSGVGEIYSLGDKIYLTTTIIPEVVQGKFEINLICENNSINLERMSAEPRFVVNNKVEYSTFIKLTPEYISDLKGRCNIQVSLGQEKAATKTFIISDRVIIKASLNKVIYNPGETISLILEATKENGQYLNGFFSLNGIFDIEKQIMGGKLTEKFLLPMNIGSGNYNLNLKAYDSENNLVLNSGESIVSFEVNQVPELIQLSMSNLKIIPGERLSVTADLLDQTKNKTKGTISLKITSPKGEIIQKTVQSGELTDFYFPFNSLAGEWNLEAISSNLLQKEKFSLEKIQKVNFSIVENTLIVENIGNDIYNGQLKVKIGDEEKQVDITNLAIGQEKRFSLSAPNGEYPVTIYDNDNQIQKSILLTGAAIGINEFKGISIFSKYPAVWIFIIIILALIAFILLVKLKKTPFKLIGYLREGVGKFKHDKKQFKTIEFKDDFSLKTKEKIYEAEHTLVLKGEKQNSAVVVLKVHGYYGMNENLKSQIKDIVFEAEKKKAAIETTNNSFIIIFNPQTTKTFSNENIAREFSFNLYKKMSELARKTKIKFGIGLNSGELISGLDNGKLKYTSLGNTVLLARRLSEMAENKAYVSENIRKKMLKAMKTEKVTLMNNTQIYEITNFSDSSANNAKLDDLLKRVHHD